MSFRGVAKSAFRSAAVVGAAGAACVAYAAAVEVRWFTLRRFTVPVLPQGAEPLKVLHLGPGPGRPRARPDRQHR
jgi:hypothetical protein